MKIPTEAQFLDRLRALFASIESPVLLTEPPQIESITFLRQLHPDPDTITRLLSKAGKSMSLPADYAFTREFIHHANYNVQDYYHELLAVQEAQREQGKRRILYYTVWVLALLSGYGIVTVQIPLAFICATVGSSMLTYLQKGSAAVK